MIAARQEAHQFEISSCDNIAWCGCKDHRGGQGVEYSAVGIEMSRLWERHETWVRRRHQDYSHELHLFFKVMTYRKALGNQA
jgi:hypothetical protein